MDLDISSFIDILAHIQATWEEERVKVKTVQTSLIYITNLVADLVYLMCCYLLLVTVGTYLKYIYNLVAIFADDKKEQAT